MIFLSLLMFIECIFPYLLFIENLTFVLLKFGKFFNHLGMSTIYKSETLILFFGF
jgi:hypothetical protein